MCETADVYETASPRRGARLPREPTLGHCSTGGGAGGSTEHLQGSTCGYLFLETLAGSSAPTFSCSLPTSFSSCGTKEKPCTGVRGLPAHRQWLSGASRGRGRAQPCTGNCSTSITTGTQFEPLVAAQQVSQGNFL